MFENPFFKTFYLQTTSFFSIEFGFPQTIQTHTKLRCLKYTYCFKCQGGYFVFRVARSTSCTKIPTKTLRRRRMAGQRRRKASSSSSDLPSDVGLQQQYVHTSLSHQSPIFSSFIYLILSSCCVTFFLMYCSHPDFAISVGHFFFNFMFHTFFGSRSLVTLKSAY